MAENRHTRRDVVSVPQQWSTAAAYWKNSSREGSFYPWPKVLFEKCCSGAIADLTQASDPVQDAIAVYSQPTAVCDAATLASHVVFKVEKSNPEGRMHIELHHLERPRSVVNVTVMATIGAASRPPLTWIVQADPMRVQSLNIDVMVGDMSSAVADCVKWTPAGIDVGSKSVSNEEVCQPVYSFSKIMFYVRSKCFAKLQKMPVTTSHCKITVQSLLIFP